MSQVAFCEHFVDKLIRPQKVKSEEVEDPESELVQIHGSVEETNCHSASWISRHSHNQDVVFCGRRCEGDADEEGPRTQIQSDASGGT